MDVEKRSSTSLETRKPTVAMESAGDVESGKDEGSSLRHDPRASLPLWKWVLTLVGLYCGALLYGMHLQLPDRHLLVGRE